MRKIEKLMRGWIFRQPGNEGVCLICPTPGTRKPAPAIATNVTVLCMLYGAHIRALFL